MQFIDTHTHLYLEEFDKDREEVINNAVKAGTTKMIIPNIDRSSFKPMLKLCNDFHGICYPCVGLHPSSVKADFHEELAEIEKQLKQNKFFAIGETGMDLYWDITYWREQKEALTFHFDLALKHNLPVIIHSRESYKEISEVLEDFKTSKLKGVFHCFSGDVNEADEIIQKGFLLGIGGVVTYKNS
ncbi:MAG: TatD family hydrolase, partial [Bacteroidales bacterium]|nr:TatD family hydrolase [Bacteroidales bacterium]